MPHPEQVPIHGCLLARSENLFACEILTCMSRHRFARLCSVPIFAAQTILRTAAKNSRCCFLSTQISILREHRGNCWCLNREGTALVARRAATFLALRRSRAPACIVADFRPAPLVRALSAFCAKGAIYF